MPPMYRLMLRLPGTLLMYPTRMARLRYRPSASAPTGAAITPIQAGLLLIHFLRLPSYLCHQQSSIIDFHRYIPFAFIVISWHADIFICVFANASKLLHPKNAAAAQIILIRSSAASDCAPFPLQNTNCTCFLKNVQCGEH